MCIDQRTEHLARCLLYLYRNLIVLGKPMNPVLECNGVSYYPMQSSHLNDVVLLANLVHGDNYLSDIQAEQFLSMGNKNELNCCFVAYIENILVGFRIAFAPRNWKPDRWCSPHLWPASADKIGYFKCNTVHEAHRAKSIGSHLMQLSKDTLKAQGAVAGICHTWMQSPGNSAYRYIKKAGGQQLKLHHGKWDLPDYECPVCDKGCSCEAAEMLVSL